MTDAALTPREHEDLCTLAGLIVPASKRFSVPGADDPIVFADIVASMRHELNDIRAALQFVNSRCGEPLASLELAEQMRVAAELRAMGGRAVDTLTRHILLCYYRDDRVMRSSGTGRLVSARSGKGTPILLASRIARHLNQRYEETLKLWPMSRSGR